MTANLVYLLAGCALLLAVVLPVALQQLAISSPIVLVVAALLLSVPLIQTYLDTGLVPRFPTAILITGMMIIAVLCFFAGLILDTVTHGRRELRRLAYLAQPAPGADQA